MSERIKWLDNAKGIGILLVVMGHVDFLPSPIVGAIYSFHMPLFFFLSGILVYRNNDNLNSFIIKKARTLIWPYYVFLLFHFLILYTSYKLGFNHAGNYVPDWQALTGMSELWFLFALFFAQLLLFPLRRISILWKLLTGGAIFILICLLNINNLNVEFPVNANKGSSLPFGLDLLFLSGLFVWIGVCFKGYILKKRISIALMVSCLFFALSFGYGNYYISGYQRVEFLGCFIGNPFLFLVSAISSIIVVIGVCQRVENNQWLTVLGKHSLGIYAIHWIFVPFIDVAIYHTLFKFGSSFSYRFFCALLSCTLILSLTVPIVYFIECRMKWMLGKR